MKIFTPETPRSTTCDNCRQSMYRHRRPDLACPTPHGLPWTTLIDRARALREGGMTQRSHGIPHLTSYTVGKHSYDALSLLLLLHPNPSLTLVKAVLWHDVAERWIGDLPAPAKWTVPGLGDLYEEAEDEVLASHGVPVTSEMTTGDVRWLKAVDAIEFWYWCRDELAFGNRHVENAKHHIEKYLNAKVENDDLPAEIAEFWRRVVTTPWKRGEEMIK